MQADFRTEEKRDVNKKLNIKESRVEAEENIIYPWMKGNNRNCKSAIGNGERALRLDS